MSISKGKKALLHVAKGKVGMSEDEYRALLSSEGLTSAADSAFNAAKFDRIMQRFKEMGFVSTRKKRYRPPSSKKALVSKIIAIRDDMRLTDTYIDAMAQHMFSIDTWKWLKPGDLHKLVAALSYHQKRHQ